MPKIRIASDEFAIQPQDINTDSVAGGFGKCEVEESALMLVRFFQQHGKWVPFTFIELHNFYLAQGENPNTMLFGLMGCWIDYAPVIGGIHESHPCIIMNGKHLLVTTEFVKRAAGRN